MNTDITLDELIQLATDIVNEQGRDYVYPKSDRSSGRPTSEKPGVTPNESVSCWYIHDGKPDCIAGRIFSRMGVSNETLASEEGLSASGFAVEIFGWARSDSRTLFLGFLQHWQDAGSSWGVALDRAKAAVER